MNLEIRKGRIFIADFDRQFRWYDQEAGWEIATQYLASIDLTIQKLAAHPEIGRIHRFPQRELEGIRSFQIEKPFHRHLIFYRFDRTFLEAWRVMHGARDLSRRLLEVPFKGS